MWVCASCRAGATTLGVLRQVTPRAFVTHLWRAARTVGEAGEKPCPSCTQPLIELDASDVELALPLRVCVRCFLVWIDRPSLDEMRILRSKGRSRVREAAARAEAEALAEPARIAGEAEDTLLFVLAAASDAAETIESALEP